MNKQELIYLCRQYANMFGVPVRLYENGEKIYSFSSLNLIADPVELCLNEIACLEGEINFYIYNNFFYYGIVNHKSIKFIAGPVFELKKPESELRELAYNLNVGGDNTQSFVTELKGLPVMHPDTLIQTLILFNFTVNKTMYDISDIRINSDTQSRIDREVLENEITGESESFVSSNNMLSYSIEKDIANKITAGDVQGLIDGATKVPAVSSGHLAPTLLRHQRTFFIRLETIAARAAIYAGLDFDEILTAEEMYITKCESLTTLDRIKNLQYHMLLDYADRVKKFKQYNENNTKLVKDITAYITKHIYENIKTSDIADHLCKSRVSITTEFKKQTGINLSDFIKIKKIQKAKELLTKTDSSISTISNYLGFSSQSHFSKVFKETEGITVTEYRKKHS